DPPRRRAGAVEPVDEALICGQADRACSGWSDAARDRIAAVHVGVSDRVDAGRVDPEDAIALSHSYSPRAVETGRDEVRVDAAAVEVRPADAGGGVVG